MSIVLLGSTSGSVTLQEPAVAGSTTLTLPATTGTVVVGSSAVSATGQIPFSTDGSTYTPTAKIVSGTSVTLTTQTAVEFTGIPSWVKKITIICNSVSTSGSSIIQAQIGSGSYTTSGYTSGASVSGSAALLTTGFTVLSAVFAGNGIAGIATIVNQTGNTWVYASTMATNTGSAASSCIAGGVLALGGVLDRVRITTVNGTDTFDAGTINILYE